MTCILLALCPIQRTFYYMVGISSSPIPSTRWIVTSSWLLEITLDMCSIPFYLKTPSEISEDVKLTTLISAIGPTFEVTIYNSKRCLQNLWRILCLIIIPICVPRGDNTTEVYNNVINPISVSYTHLTLPTNREV